MFRLQQWLRPVKEFRMNEWVFIAFVLGTCSFAVGVFNILEHYVPIRANFIINAIIWLAIGLPLMIVASYKIKRIKLQ